MKVLITGAEGMVGSALVRRLLRENIQVIASVYPGKKDALSDFNNDLLEIIEVDITQYGWEEVLEDVTHVIHLAAMVHIHKKNEQVWDKFYKTNVLATENICKAVIKSNIKHFLFVSTIGVYGDFPKEDDMGNLIVKPNNLYANSKLMAESVVKEVIGDKVRYNILRPVMIYGSGDKGNMARMINAINNNRFVLPGSGANKKSAIYVEDMVDIIIRLINRDDLSNETFIVSNKKVISLREMCDTISQRLGKRKVISIPFVFLKIVALVGNMIPAFPFNDNTLRKLTVDSDFSSYSVIQDILGIESETSFGEALIDMGISKNIRGVR